MKKVRSGLVEEDETVPSNALPDFQSDEEDDIAPLTSAQTSAQAAIVDIPIELTEEQLETIRRNREKAEKLRQERLRKIQEKAAVNLPEKNVLSEASTSSRINIDEDMEIQSNPAQDRTKSSRTNFDGDNSIEIASSGTNVNGEKFSEQQNGEDTDSGDELQFSKKKNKRLFVGEDDEEEERSIAEKDKSNEDRNNEILNRDDNKEGNSPNLSKNNDDIVEEMETEE